MNTQEAAKLLSLVKLSYPHAYRDLDQQSLRATVHMWAMSFPQVPYPVMERAFNGYRMENKFPPTVADLAAELRKFHLQAKQAVLIQRQLGNRDMEGRFRCLMEQTAPFGRETEIAALAAGKDEYGKMGSAGTSGNRLGTANGLPQLDAAAQA